MVTIFKKVPLTRSPLHHLSVPFNSYSTSLHHLAPSPLHPSPPQPITTTPSSLHVLPVVVVMCKLLSLCSLAVARPSSIVDCTLVWESCCHFLQHKRRDQRAELNWLCTQLAARRHFPVVIVLNQPSVPGGKASLVIGSRKNVSKLERNVLLFSRPFCRANSNRRQNGQGYPV